MSADCPWCGDGSVVPGQVYCQACLNRLCVRCEAQPSVAGLDICQSCETDEEWAREWARERAERERAEDAERGAAWV
jgi:hypothetical protein